MHQVEAYFYSNGEIYGLGSSRRVEEGPQAAQLCCVIVGEVGCQLPTAKRMVPAAGAISLDRAGAWGSDLFSF